MAKPRRFKEGRRYRCMDGTMVTVLECKNDLHGYETVRCSDRSENSPTGVHRYNRSTGSGEDNGRVTGTPFDWSDPRNLDPRQIGMRLPNSYRAPNALTNLDFRIMAGCDDRCASKRGHTCNCAMAVFSR